MTGLNFENVDLDTLSKDTPNTADFFTNFDNAYIANHDITAKEVAGLSLLIFIVILLCLTGRFLVKKYNLILFSKKNRRKILGGLSSWFIWYFSVWSYNQMFYRELEYETWCTLPPLIVVAVYAWYVIFLRKKKFG